MRPRDAALIACRTLAVILGSAFVIAFVGLGVAGALSSGEVWAVLITIILVTFVLWAAAETLADRMAAGATEPAGAPPSPSRFQQVAFAVVGVLLLATGVPGLVGTLAVQGQYGELGGSITGPHIARYVVQLVIGLGLLFGAGGLSRWVDSRPEGPAAGTPGAPPQVPPPPV